MVPFLSSEPITVQQSMPRAVGWESLKYYRPELFELNAAPNKYNHNQQRKNHQLDQQKTT